MDSDEVGRFLRHSVSAKVQLQRQVNKLNSY